MNRGCLMIRVVTAGEMKELDRRTIEEMEMPSAVLMERAALAVKEEILRRFPEGGRVLCACGGGNNGGDGIAVGRLLHLCGYDVQILLAGSEEHRSEENRHQERIARRYGVPFTKEPDYEDFDVIIDALFGIGLSREIASPFDRIIEKINDSDAFVLACDIASGIHADHGGTKGPVVMADMTVTFAFPKAGQLLYPGRHYSGELVVSDIGIYENEDPGNLYCLEEEDLSGITARLPWGNKATFGKVGIVGGAPGMAGAVCLSAAGAFCTGAGMVKIQTSEANRIPVQTRLPEAMTQTDLSEKACRDMLAWADVFVLGPGMGQSKEAESLLAWYLKELADSKKRTVLDADALNLLSRNPEWKQYIGDHIVITPHPGEMSRLCGKPVNEILGDPLENARAFAKEWGCVVVQKDACTVTADPEGTAFLNPSGNDGMAAAGSGDVLSGIIGGILGADAQRERKEPEADAFKAACAVFLHGCGGDKAALRKGRHGMKAWDIAEGAAEVLKDLWNVTEE